MTGKGFLSGGLLAHITIQPAESNAGRSLRTDRTPASEGAWHEKARQSRAGGRGAAAEDGRDDALER